MNYLVKQIKNEDREAIPEDEQVWHYESVASGDPCVLCTGEFTSGAAGSGEYKRKNVKKGGITCKHCLKIIKQFKAIKL